jgi:hypothetical protein
MPKMLDLTGNKYGEWTVIRRERTSKDFYHYWLCRCKCGKEVVLNSYYIRNVWKATDCGCSTTIVGKKFGRLTVIGKIGIKSNTMSDYICKCECGSNRNYRGHYLIRGLIKSCGCARLRTPEMLCYKIVRSTYRNNAKKRGIEFKLSLEEVMGMIKDKCHYCGSVESNTKKFRKFKDGIDREFKCNGIDRKDNDKGYIKGNMVACCGTCNMMKREMSIIEWTDHMKKVLEYTKTAGV